MSAPAKPLAVRSKARVIGAAVAIIGLFVVLWVGGRSFSGQTLGTFHYVGVLMMVLAACIILVGLILDDIGRSSWALPLVQLGAVGTLLGLPALIIAAFLALRGGLEAAAPVLVSTVLAAILGIYLMSLGGQARADITRRRRRRR